MILFINDAKVGEARQMKTYEELRNRADYRAYLENSKGYTEDTFNAVCQDCTRN